MDVLKVFIFSCLCLVHPVQCKGSGSRGKTTLKTGTKTRNVKDKRNEQRRADLHSTHSIDEKTHEPRMPPEGYDPTEYGEHGSVMTVNMTFWIESVIKIDLSAMEFTLHAYLILEWYDKRLANVRNHSVVLRDRSLIFVPDPYCVNCQDPSVSSNSNEFQLRIHPNGVIYYSQSVTLSPTCRMSLRHFPFDWHQCKLELSSYAHNNSYLQFRWAREPSMKVTQLQQFTVTDNIIKGTRIANYISGNFTIMSITVEIKRQQGFYILQVYVPCIILVFLSWIIFFMNPDQVGDRLAIGVTLILTMIFLLGYVNGSLPKVSYIKAIDWYMISALLLISMSLVETVFVYWHWMHFSQLDYKEENNNDVISEDESELIVDTNVEDGLTSKKKKPVAFNGTHVETILRQAGMFSNSDELNGSYAKKNRFTPGFRRRFLEKSKLNNIHLKQTLSRQIQHPNISRKLDRISRVAFPVIFIFYNIGYFIRYTTNKGVFTESI